MNLYEISKQMQNIYEDLQNGIGVDEYGEIAPETLELLKLTQANLQEKSIDYGYVIKSFDDEIDTYDKEIKRLTAQKKQMQNVQEHLKSLLKGAMEQFNIKEIKGKTIKLSFRKSESVVVDDESLLDQKFIKTKVETSVDKTAIKEAIKNGEDVQGARLVENNNLQIK